MALDFLRQVYYVAWGDMRFMRHNFANILIMSIMSPILYLIAFGFGLRTGETSIGVSYVAFVIPGIAALSSLSSSFSSTSTRMNVQRLYYKSFDEMMMCPLSLSAIVLGKCMLGIVRGLIASGLIYILGLCLPQAPELVASPLVVLCIVLSCVVFSMLGMAAALIARSHQSMATFNSLIILPMTFLCGTFFSVSDLNVVILKRPRFSVTASECIRAVALPDYLPFPVESLLVLVGFGLAFFALDHWLLKTRKV